VKTWLQKRSPGEKLALLVGTPLIAWYLYGRFFSRDRSGGSSDQDVTVTSSGLTYDPGYYSVLADEIEAAFFGTPFQLWERDQDAAFVLSQLWSDDDVSKLIQVYGIRGATFLTSGYTLPAAVVSFLDADYKETINELYQGRGITYQW
jgi:hypothetical protein